MAENILFSFEAEPGMILSRDIYTDDGTLVANAGTVLDQEAIDKIRSYHILEIYVVDEEASDYVPEPETTHYYEALRQTEEFKEFHKSYMESTASVRDQLSNFVDVSSSHINVTQLLKGPYQLMANSSNSYRVFDMLHGMREFDDSTFIHCINVSLIAAVLGKWLNYSEGDIALLMLSGLLHDIGKLIIPSHVLNKPGKLTAGEYSLMKTHAMMGYNRIKNEPIDARVKEACLLHHERYDGSGYPFAMKGKEIPDFAKIIAIADVYDAMTASRVYRGALCPFEVIAMMEADSFSKYDPKFIVPFLNNITSSYLNSTVKLSDGRIGEVIMINPRAISKPTVRCGNDFIDLSKSGLTITAIV